MSNENMSKEQLLELEKSLVELDRARAETHKFVNESLLTAKKSRWYELVIFGGAGITVGLALAKIFGS